MINIIYNEMPFCYTRNKEMPLKAYGKVINSDIKHPWDILETKPKFQRFQGKNITLRNSEIDETNGPVHIGDGVRIFNSEIRGPAWIGEGTKIGPFALIRKGSVGKNCKIGHSVEIKNSIIMRDTKIPHLSYVGDSVIGSDVNIGGGSVIANLRHDEKKIKIRKGSKSFDTGRRKLGAIIGDNVKTGVKTKILEGRILGPYTFTSPGSIVKENLNPFEILKEGNKERMKKTKVKEAFPRKEAEINKIWRKVCAE